MSNAQTETFTLFPSVAVGFETTRAVGGGVTVLVLSLSPSASTLVGFGCGAA